MNADLPHTLLIEADTDPEALLRILDRFAVLQLAYKAVRVDNNLNAQIVVIELRAAEPARLDLVVNRLAAMPCVRRVAVPSDEH